MADYDLTEAEALADLTAVMLDYYDDVVDFTQQKSSSFAAFTSAKEISLEGHKVYKRPLRVGVAGGGSGIRAEGARLPVPTQQSWDTATAQVIYQYLTLALSGPVLRTTKGKGTLIEELHMLISGATESMARDTNRMVMDDGLGIIANIVSVQGSNVILLDKTKNITVGHRIGAWASNTEHTNGNEGYVVTAVDHDAKTITVDDDTQLAASDVICQYGNLYSLSGTRTSLEFPGWASIISPTGTYLGIDKAAKYYWRPKVDSNNNTLRDLTHIVFQKFLDEKFTDLRKDPPSNIWVDTQMNRALAWLLRDTAVPTESIVTEFGREQMTFHYGNTRFKIESDPGLPANAINFIDYKSFKRLKAAQPGWVAGTVGERWHWIHDYDMYQAVYYDYWGFMCDNPAANGQLSYLNNYDSKTT